MSDWRSGTLLGAGYAFVVNGKVASALPTKEALRELWERGKEIHHSAPFPEHLVRQICYILPPWEKSEAPQ